MSQPADTIVTRLAVTKSSDVRAALDDVLADAPPGDRTAQAKLLYAGLAQRCASTAIIVAGQFILFDGFRTLLAVGNNDLSVDRALVELTDTAGLNGAARKKAAKKKKQKEARKAELEAALQEARDEGNGGDSDDPRVAQLEWLQENGGS